MTRGSRERSSARDCALNTLQRRWRMSTQTAEALTPTALLRHTALFYRATGSSLGHVLGDSKGLEDSTHRSAETAPNP